MNNYYDRSDLKRIPEIIQLAQQSTASYLSFEKDVYSESNKIPLITKELIAIAVAHVVGCPYCIDAHVQKYRDLGGTREEIMEAVMVSASTRAGAVISHATQALKAFDGVEENNKAESTSTSAPKCFCG